MSKTPIFITSPLEDALVARIRAVDPSRIEVIHEPDLLPPIRYLCDHKGSPDFRRTPEQAERWVNALGRAEILFDCPLPTDTSQGDIVHATRARWLQTTSSGIAQLVRRAGLADRGLIVTTARGVHSGPLAEWTFMALLMHFRKARYLEAEQRMHRWERYCDQEIAGRTLVTIGAGDLARAVAVIARAFGMKVFAITRRPDKPRAHAGVFDGIFSRDRLSEMLSQADAVVATLPDTDETLGFLDRAAIARMKQGCAFVNTGRGNTIDEVALIEALKSGKIAFAALDVTTIEPLDTKSPLWDLPNVLICPHSASTVTTENSNVVDIFCANLGTYLDGRPEDMVNIFDMGLMY